MIELILGGARSGKSACAERRAIDSGLAITYIATADFVTSAGDGEMAARIAHHKTRRPSHWGLVEEPLRLAATLRKHAAPDRLLLVDCLTLWLSNLLFSGKAAQQAEAGENIDCPLLREETQALVECLQSPNELPGHVILVSNEVGLGIIPMGATTRLYVDEAGRLNQRVAQACGRVTFVAAGLPLELKTP